MPSAVANAQTRKEWRDLGFFYDRDDRNKRWLIVGSRTGVGRLCELLRQYVADPRNARLSEHEHFGPYMYLEVMTWTEPKMDRHAIAGRIGDLARLADLLESRLATAAPGDRFTIASEYGPASAYVLEVQVAPDGFDPATADPGCQDQPST